MRQFYYFLYFSLFIISSIKGQLVWTEPTFPQQTDTIKVFFDASKGNQGLKDFSGDVYMHAGVITNQSSSPTDWKYVQGTWGVADSNVQMTFEGNNIYSKEYNITDFYGIPAGVIVEQLAFVFRNADGSKAGRTTDGSDIYIDVYPEESGLLVDLISPQDNNTILFEGDGLNVTLEINKASAVTISVDDSEVFAANTDLVDQTFNVIGIGSHDIVIVVENEEEVVELRRSFLVLDPVEIREDAPNGTINGINYLPSSYIFQLTAPEKDFVFLLSQNNNYKPDLNYRLKKSMDGTYYWIELPKTLFANGNNTYQYLVDGLITIADPFSTVVLDPINDQWVPEEHMKNLPSYPDEASGIVTAFDMELSSFDWSVEDFEKRLNGELVIYEILMRDFLGDKSYISLLDTLDYLADLGINAIELMPISEFEGNQSWGYNPSFHMAVDKYYGSKEQLKAVIDACHRKGMAVILDVVFNHAFSQSPLCQLYWNAAEFRPSASNPYLNEVARHPFNVGYDFNHESIYTKQWVKQVLSYWIEEFKMDGFRFDLSKGLTQTNSGSNSDAMAQYDQSRINILKDYYDHITSIDPTSYVIMEHFAANSEEKVLSDHGMMLWGNLSHDWAEAAMGYSSDLEWSDYTVRGWDDPHLISYMESHDEERMAYKIKSYGDQNSDYNTRELPTLVERIAATNTIYFSIPGPKMMWQFGELAYDESINRCTNASISPDCRLEPKPIHWDYFEDSSRRLLYDKLSAILYLRNNFPAFATDDFTFSDGNFFLKTVHLRHEDLDVVSMANFRIVNSDLNPKFPNVGTWYEYFSGEAIEVTDTEKELTFGPGEYRIYLSKSITPPGGVFTNKEDQFDNNIKLYPNPISISNDIQIAIPENISISSVKLVSSDGKIIIPDHSIVDNLLKINTNNLVPGISIVKIYDNIQIYSLKVVIIP